MTDQDFYQILKDLVEGKYTPQQWFAWWEQNQAVAKKSLSPGEFIKLKPKGASHGDVAMLERCVEEAKQALAKRNIAFNESTEQTKTFQEDDVRRHALTEFGGSAIGVAEDEFAASLSQEYIHDLYERFLATQQKGSPKPWLRQVLVQEFLSTSARPRWQGLPQWPFLGKQPMVFLGQIDVPRNAVTESHAAPDETLYLFGLRQYESDGRTFTMKYEIVRQDRDDRRNRRAAEGT